jgi:diaminopimelate epimerase
MIPFVKGHGLGNDYLVVRAADLPGGCLGAAAARRLCDRHRGIGADGVLVHVPSPEADAGVRIFNPDGSEAEKSGNGLRIFAKYLYDHRHVATPAFRVGTPSGVVACACRVTAGRVASVAVEMGSATFEARAIPMLGVRGDAVDVTLELPPDERVVVTAVSVGNPHCVVFDGAVTEARCRTLGPRLERHAAFPRRTNVQLARVPDSGTIEIRIWERGAGYTLASGSSSCAAAAAAVRTGRARPGALHVVMPGGTLAIEVRPDWSIRLEGPAVEVFTGAFDPTLLTALDA